MAYGDSTIWIGYDDREPLAYAVARHSIRSWVDNVIPVRGVVLQDLIDRGWYRRAIEKRPTKQGGVVLWDPISDAPMSTQFAISRFFVLQLASTVFKDDVGWAMFVDCDVLARTFVSDLFSYASAHCDKALLCVPHQHQVTEGAAKKIDQIQVNYSRKNWSSVMLFNRAHPSNRKLTLEMLNELPGRDLHRFCWLTDEEIGHLDFKWNHLVGVEGSQSPDPAIVHFTNGGPWLPEYANVEYADDWRRAYRDWVK